MLKSDLRVQGPQHQSMLSLRPTLRTLHTRTLKPSRRVLHNFTMVSGVVEYSCAGDTGLLVALCIARPDQGGRPVSVKASGRHEAGRMLHYDIRGPGGDVQSTNRHLIPINGLSYRMTPPEEPAT